ncbi:MAG: flippase activity-associated protein Agl23 [Pyrinomonadaceae bacterium]
MAKAKRTQKPEPVVKPVEPELTSLSPSWWWAGCVVVTAVGAFLRLYKLGLKPFHHDEGVNGFFMTSLVRQGVYHYNPKDYHGPSLYYFALASTKLFGLNGMALRLTPVVFGLATIVLVLCLRRYIGAVGALSAGLLLAVSPGAIYISRYFIHETLFVFFTLVIVVALLRWHRTTNVTYLIAAAASAALLFATKETAFISIGVLVIAGLMVAGLAIAQADRKVLRREGVTGFVRGHLARDLERFGGATGLAVQLFAAVSAFVIVYVVFFSSFFTHRTGVLDSFKAYTLWGQTGTKEHTTNGWYAYLWWSRKSEFPLFVIGGIGALLAVWSRRNLTAIFIALWAWGMFAAYTLIPYKTPWLALNFVIPLALVSGVAFDWLGHGTANREGKVIAGTLLLAATLFCGYWAIQLNFYHYDDDDYPYVYAHSKREMLALVDEINKYAAKSEGTESGIIFCSPDYWPLPWYLRDYTRVGFYGKISPPGNSAIMIGRSDQREELDTMLLGRYRMTGEFPLRPGVVLLLYVRNDLVEGGEPPK